VKRYSDFISHPIELAASRERVELAAKDGFEVVNRANALWTRSEKDITQEQYDELYKHLTRDFEPPLGRMHFHVEGTQMFTGLLYLPKRAPFDLGDPTAKHGVRLYVRRVFIMDQCEELLPRWLRFVRGVIDSDDLPLNVSRELLQDSAVVRTIKKQITRRVLDLLAKIAEEKPDEYVEFWKQFGAVIKEGLHFEPQQAEKISPLLRYESSRVAGYTSLAEYVKRMPEGQTKIYYAQGMNKALIAGSPHLEALEKKNYEVLFMTDGVDQWAVEGLGEFEGKPLCDAMQEDALGADGEAKSESDKQASEEQSKELAGLLARVKHVLDGHVSDVRVSERLTDSPACLVIPKGGLPAHLERLLRAHKADLPEQKRILELNPTHPIVQRMKGEHDKQADAPKLTEWIELLYDQALLAEGSPLPDPQRFSKRFVALLQTAL
jgi:molecular chaperone HtpG